MIYVYGCSDKSHPTVEVHHGMKEVVHLSCKVCGQPLHKIPQVFNANFPDADSGVRNAKEVTSFLVERRNKNKARMEAREYSKRKAQEGIKQNAYK